MRFKQYLESVSLELDELIVKGTPLDEVGRGDYIIAYLGNVWVVNQDNFEEFNDEIIKALDVNITHQTNDLYNFVNNLQEYFKDVIVAQKEYDSLKLVSMDLNQSTASKSLLKVMDYFKVDSVQISVNDLKRGEDYFISRQKELFKDIDKNTIFYHGTSTRNLELMFKGGGLMPNPERTNFSKLKHHDKVFITLNLEKAFFHAETASKEYKDKKNSKRNRSEDVPVILAMTIPDMSKLVPDYDVALMIGGDDVNTLGYDEVLDLAGGRNTVNLNLKKRLEKSGHDLNKSLGIFGYTGRIPMENFKTIIVDEDLLLKKIINDEYDMGAELTTEKNVDEWEEIRANNGRELRQKYLEKLNNLRQQVEQEYGNNEDEENY
jgi:hypothetical protein